MSKVRPGQPLAIRARDWNDMLDAAEAHRRNALQQLGGMTSPTTPAHSVTIRNDAASDVDRFGVLALRESIVTAADNELGFLERQAYAAVEPARVDDFLVIAREPIVSGAFGSAVLAGLSPVTVDILDRTHRYARPVPGETGFLRSAPWGPARILHLEEGSAQQWATVLLDNRPVGPCVYTLDLPGHGLSVGKVWNVTRSALADLASITGTDTIGLVLDASDPDHVTVLAEGDFFAPDLVADHAEFLSTTAGDLTYDGSGDGTWRLLLHRGHPDGLVHWYPRLQRKIGICVDGVEVPHWVDCEIV